MQTLYAQNKVNDLKKELFKLCKQLGLNELEHKKERNTKNPSYNYLVGLSDNTTFFKREIAKIQNKIKRLENN